MNAASLEFENPIRDAISRIRFAPRSNNLLISSWDSTLRLYDVDNAMVKLEITSESPLLDCCFQDEFVAFSASSDGFIRRYDLYSGKTHKIGNHDDIAMCIGYSDETYQLVTVGLDRKIVFWDTHMAQAHVLKNISLDVESMSLFGFHLIVANGASLYLYDLRNLEKPVQSKDSQMDVQIGCIASIPYYSQGFAVGSVDGRVALEIPSTEYVDDIRYIFRCNPKAKTGKTYLVPVNDIAFHPTIPGPFVTGDNEGFVIAWDFLSKRKVLELPRYPNKVASLSYNNGGQILAVASSYTYQDALEIYSYMSWMVATWDPLQLEVQVGDDSFAYGQLVTNVHYPLDFVQIASAQSRRPYISSITSCADEEGCWWGMYFICNDVS